MRIMVWVQGPGPYIAGFETNTSSYSGTTWGATLFYPVPHTMWLKLKNDGTNMYEYYSYDGVTWVQAFTAALSGFFLGATGYNQVCFMEIVDSGSVDGLMLMSYKQTSP